VDGEGTVGNYWDYMSLIEDGVATLKTDQAYC
jgi:hypothetical protein